jgi:hypothetical protein
MTIPKMELEAIVQDAIMKTPSRPDRIVALEYAQAALQAAAPFMQSIDGPFEKALRLREEQIVRMQAAGTFNDGIEAAAAVVARHKQPFWGKVADEIVAEIRKLVKP